MPHHPNKFLLASASPRRRELLERMGLRFEVHPANVEEATYSEFGPSRMVMINAERKARCLSAQFPDALVLGSDTTVALGEEVLNKPDDMEQARIMLRRLSGRRHSVFTAVALYWEQGGLQEVFVERSEVQFKPFGEEVIDRYFQIVNPLDKAGGYGIQQARELIIEEVEGSVENVMGLPVQLLERKLLELHIDFKV